MRELYGMVNKVRDWRRELRRFFGVLAIAWAVQDSLLLYRRRV